AAYLFVSRVLAPAPGAAAVKRFANLRITTPLAKPQGRATRKTGCASRNVDGTRVSLGDGLL
ncbi:MAG: hypothetical protein ACKO0N_02360, partial [Planctomycetota bacterium]